MQKEVAERFGVSGEIISLDVRPQMTNGMVPDIVADSRKLPFPNGTFETVLFDPPFSFRGGKIGTCGYPRFYITYGINLYKSRAELGAYIEQTFIEISRVLRTGGLCLFKWNESRIKLDYPMARKGEFDVERRWERSSKHWGTKTGTPTIYLWLRKSK